MSAKFEIFRPTIADTNAAGLVSSWTHGEHMLEKTPDEMLGLFKQGRSILVYEIGRQDDPLGHAAITATYPDNTVEIGAIVIHPEFRKHGVGTVATLAVIELAEAMFPGYGRIAIANPASGGLFTKLGARVMDPGELCAEVWEACATCPKKPSQSEGQPFACCDKPFDLDSLHNFVHLYMRSWLSMFVWRNDAKSTQ